MAIIDCKYLSAFKLSRFSRLNLDHDLQLTLKPTDLHETSCLG